MGSTTGIALAAAGAVQLALVSRPLRDTEEGLGLTFLPYARTAVVIGADPDTPETVLTTGELLSFYRGTKLTWSNGREIALLTREEGDSSIASLRDAMPGFAEAYAAGALRRHWTVLYNEPTMHEALLTRPFALGLSDLGTTTIERLPIKALAIDGIAPTLENVATGRYPFIKTLGFAWREATLPASSGRTTAPRSCRRTVTCRSGDAAVRVAGGNPSAPSPGSPGGLAGDSVTSIPSRARSASVALMAPRGGPAMGRLRHAPRDDPVGVR